MHDDAAPDPPPRFSGRALVLVFLAGWAVVFGVVTLFALHALGILGG